MKLRIINDYVRVRKCVNEDVKDENGNVLLYFSDESKEFTTMAEIIDVGEKCRLITKNDIGSIIRCPELANRHVRISETDWMIAEDVIMKHEACVYEE